MLISTPLSPLYFFFFASSLQASTEEHDNNKANVFTKADILNRMEQDRERVSREGRVFLMWMDLLTACFALA